MTNPLNQYIKMGGGESAQMTLYSNNNHTKHSLIVPPLKSIPQNITENQNLLLTTSTRQEENPDTNNERKLKKISFLLPYIDDENTIEDTFLTEQYFNIITIDELVCTLLVILSIGSGLTYYEIRTREDDYTEEIEINNRDDAIDFSLISSSIGAFGFILMLIPKYYHSYFLYKSAKYLSEYENFFSSPLPWYLLIEFIFAIIHPNLLFKHKFFTTSSKYNNFEIKYNVNDLFLAVNLCRVVYIVRFIVIVSDFYSARADRICKLMAKELNLFFSFKSLLITHTAFTLILCIVLFCFLFSYLLKLFDGPLHFTVDHENELNNLNNLINCIWTTLSTMSTVGYGDHYPRSLIGRALGCIIAISGPLLVALITNFFQTKTLLADEEKQAYLFVGRLHHKDLIRQAAAKYFRSNFEYVIFKRKYLNDIVENNEENKKKLLILSKKRFLNRKRFKHLVHEFQIKFKMEDDIDKIKRKINELDEALIESNENMKNLNTNIELLIHNIGNTGLIESIDTPAKRKSIFSSKSLTLNINE